MTDTPAGRQEIWVEKYRPEALDDVVGHEAITSRLKSYVERDDLPHLLFAGPAGVGKCVVSDTPVLTNEGIQHIDNVVGEVEGFAAPDEDLEVVTFDQDGEFRFTAPSQVFSKEAGETVTVETRDGGTFTVTPEHRLLVLDGDGLDWVQAENLDAGTRIARPLHAPLPEPDPELNWFEKLDGGHTFVHVTDEFATAADIPAEEDYVGVKKQVFGLLRQGKGVSEISNEVDAPQKTVQQYARDAAEIDLTATSTTCSLGYLRENGYTLSDVRNHVERIEYVTRNNQRSLSITPPSEMTADLAQFVGLIVSEARIDAGRVRFYNTDETLLQQFERTARTQFGLEPERKERKGVPFVEMRSQTLTHFLESCFDVIGDSAGGIGSGIVQANDEARAAFLRAVFDAEGHVTENGILELTQKDGDVITLLAYLLANFGIPTRRKREMKAATNGTGLEREYHTLYVSNAQHLARFEEHVGFTIDEKQERLATAASRDSNPNHDTLPVQRAADDLCAALNLPKGELLTRSLNPETPGREAYLADIERVLDAATAQIETAQQTRRQLDKLESDLSKVTKVPATWVGERTKLGPLDTRKEVSETTGIRTDRLLEYSDGRRTPPASRGATLLAELSVSDSRPPVESVQQELQTAIDDLNLSYNAVADTTPYRGTDVSNLLRGDDHDLASLTRFETVTERVRELADEMLSTDVLENIKLLDDVASADLYYDEVECVKRTADSQRVFDLTVPETHNYVAGNVPTVMHNTASAVAVAKELYGDDWRENFLELNASDERGIDVVRDRIKNFARASFGGYNHRIIFLDEADALTSDAQSALRRTMEQFSNNTRFILSCNYSSQIIDPIQSRCAVFRYAQIDEDAVAKRIREIAENEGVEYTDEGIDALVYAADGDMRKAINALQAASATGDVVDEEAVYAITSTARPEEIEDMVTSALEGDFGSARSALDEMVTQRGLAGGDIIDQLHRSVWEFDIDDEAAVQFMDRIGEADYRIAEGANEKVQLEALLASVALEHR